MSGYKIENLGKEWFKQNKLPASYFYYEESSCRNDVYFSSNYIDTVTGRVGKPIGWCWSKDWNKYGKDGIIVMIEVENGDQYWQHFPVSSSFEKELKNI